MGTIEQTYANLGFGVRGMYHFNFAEKLDAYAGLTLGYVIQSYGLSYLSAGLTLKFGGGSSGGGRAVSGSGRLVVAPESETHMVSVTVLHGCFDV